MIFALVKVVGLRPACGFESRKVENNHFFRKCWRILSWITTSQMPLWLGLHLGNCVLYLYVCLYVCVSWDHSFAWDFGDILVKYPLVDMVYLVILSPSGFSIQLPDLCCVTCCNCWSIMLANFEIGGSFSFHL